MRARAFSSESRFISTCVEQTIVPCGWMTMSPVHLHVRGADKIASGAVTLGKRFISTCVEQTCATSAPPTWTSVHLHVRGADSKRSTAFVRLRGSSPRAWSRQVPSDF